MNEKENKERERDPYALKYIYEEMELELIASMRRNLVKHKMDEHKAGFSWEMWQKTKLRNLQEYRKETTSIIYRYQKRIRQAIEQVLRRFFSVGERKADIKMPKNGVNTGAAGQEPPKETQFFGMNEKKLNALMESTKNDFEDVNNAIYRKMDDFYRQTVFKVVYQMSSGSISLDKAIDKAVEGFLDKGIDCIVYSNGRHVNIADYAEMALRTASHRATLLGEGSKRDELGVHLVFVSVHANSCKLCLPWQGQILIDDVFSHPSEEYIDQHKDKYKLLSEAIKAGLLHPNCRHTLATYFEGITRLPEPQDPEKALENYNNEQKQRQLEREIRKRKRILAGTVDESDKKKASADLRQAQKNLRDFLKAHPEFKRHYRREKVYDQENLTSPDAKSNVTKSDVTNSDEIKNEPKYKEIAVLNNDFITKEFGKLQTNKVILMDERKQHIVDRHPGDYETLQEYGKKCIESPKIILRDSKHDGTVFMISDVPDSNLNILIRLVLEGDNPNYKNSIITSYRLNDNKVKKLMEKHKVIYKEE